MNISTTTVSQSSLEVDGARSPAVAKTEDVKLNHSSSVVPFRNKEAKAGEEDISKREAEAIVDTLNEYTNVLQTKLGFSLNEEAEKVVITVRNKETDEIIRQIPAEELLLIQEKMEELTGLLLNKKA